MTPEGHRKVTLEIRRVIPAAPEPAESLALELRQSLHGLCGAADVFAVELLAREALSNAFRHGSAETSGAENIHFAVRVHGGRAVLSVCDEGPGFDWRTAAGHVAEVDDPGGRGLGIFRAYADQVRFSEKGNRVILVRRFAPGERSG